MDHKTKHYSTHLIRSGKPAVQPDGVFVNALQERLRNRAVELAQQPPHTMPQPWWKKYWFSITGIVSLGALAVIAGLMIVPTWLHPNYRVTGYIQKGPFISGTAITVQELDNQLQPTGVNYQVTTASDFGDYRLAQDIHSQYVEVIAQGYYYDEVRGALSSAPLTLRAIANVSDHQAINVNVLTTLAAPRLRHLIMVDRMDFTLAKKLTEQEVLHIFQITDDAGSGFEEMNLSATGNSNGILLAASVLLQGHQSVAELSELLSKLSLAIKTDGVLASDSPLLTTIQTNASTLNTYQIKENLTNRFKELGVTAAVPNFVDLLTPFTNNPDSFTYRVTLGDNVFGVNNTSGATVKVTVFGDQFIADQEEVSLKNTIIASHVTYVNDHTLIAEFPIETLSAGSYTVQVRNTATQRTGVTDGLPLEKTSTNPAQTRLILRGYAPTILTVNANVTYLKGGTITVTGDHFAYGSFVSINGWQVPDQAVRIANDNRIDIDLSPALIADNAALPRRTNLTLIIQTPDFQTVSTTHLKTTLQIK